MVTPVARLIAQSVFAAIVALAAVNVSFAVAVPELDAAAVNVVEPQPLVE